MDQRNDRKFFELLALFPFFLTPLLLFTPAHDEFELPKLTLLMLIAVPAALFLLWDRPARIPTPLGWALVLFSLAQTLACLPMTSLSWRSSLWGDYENFSGWVTLATCLTLFAFYSRILTWALLEKVLFFNSLAAILSSFYAIAQHFGLDPIHWNPGSVVASREFAALGNPNFLAAYLAMSLPLFLAWARGRGWLFTGPCLFVMAFGLLSTGSRGGFLAALAGLAVWAVLVPRSPVPTPSRRWVPWALGAAALVPLFFFHGAFWGRFLDSIAHAGNSLATSRLHIWGPALKMALAHPFTGVGLDTFKIAFPFYSGIEFNQIDGMFVSSRMAHDQFLQLAATTGFLGLASYLLVLGAAAWMGQRTFRTATPEKRWWMAGLFASMAAYQVQGLFSFDVAALDLLWFFLLAVLQWRSWEDATPSPARTGSVRAAAWLLKPFALLVLLGGLLFPLSRLSADLAFGRASAAARYAAAQSEEASSFSDYEILMMKKAVAFFPGEVKYRLYLGLAYERRARLGGNGTDWWSLALPCYERTIAMSPSNAYYYNNLGRVHSALGADHGSEAVKAYGEAVRLDPVNPYFLLSWAGALERTQGQAQAKEPVERAFRLDADFSAKVLAQMAFEDYRQGDKERAFRRFDWAIQGAPQNPEARYGRGILYLSEDKRRLALADFLKVKELGPTPEKNPSIQHLDQLIKEAKNKDP